MFTLFTTAKPFHGHDALIQRNALTSWTLLHPRIEVILFGDEEGVAEAARDLGLRHEPQVERNEAGMKRIDSLFDSAEEKATNDILCYVNCDIVLTREFSGALEQVSTAYRHFLMVGRRWDTDVTQPINFEDPHWAEDLQNRAAAASHPRDEWWIDYFAFRRGLYRRKIPPFVIGRVRWDNWLIWYALRSGVSVVDASTVVRAIHQNHSYGYHPDGQKGVFTDWQTARNLELAGGWKNLRTIGDAKFILSHDRLRRNYGREWRAVMRAMSRASRFAYYRLWNPAWFLALGATRPIRRVLGLRLENLRRLRKKT